MESFIYGLAAIMITIGVVSLCSYIKAFLKKKLRRKCK
jgi:hypothetical protein